MKVSGLFITLSLMLSAAVGTNAVLPHAPMSAVKSLVGIQDATSPWNVLADPSLGEDEVVEIFEELEQRVGPLIANSVVIAIHRDTVVLDHLPAGVETTYNVTIPHANAISLTAASLPILLHGQDPERLMIPVKDVFAKSDVVIPKSFHAKNLVQLLNSVSKIDRGSVGFLNELNLQGRVVIQTINALIGKDSQEAWINSLADLGLEDAKISDSNKITAPLHNFYILLDALLSLLKLSETVPDNQLPYNHPEHYTFGWWLNCNLKDACLRAELPEDTIISASPNMRIYVVESLDLALAVIHTTQLSVNTHSFNKLLEADGKIWSQLLKMITKWDESRAREQQPNQPSESESREGEREDIKEERLPENGDTRDSDNDAGKRGEEVKRDDVDVTDELEVDQLPEREEVKTDTRSDGTTPQEVVRTKLWDLLHQARYYFDLYLEFTGKQHWVVRGIFWVLFLTVAHFVVYFWLHVFWYLLKTIVPWAHDPRPKLTKQE